MALDSRSAPALHGAAGVVKAEKQYSSTPSQEGHSILPVDSGFIIDGHVYQRNIKGEDIAFNFRSDRALLGRPMPTVQVGRPEDWKLNFDVFVICDGHSGCQVRTSVP